MADDPVPAERATCVRDWPEWGLVRDAERRGGAPYVAALAHWTTWRGRWLAARGRGDFAAMLAAELSAERHARTMRNALRWRGVPEERIAATMAAHRRVTDQVMGHAPHGLPIPPPLPPLAEFVRRLKADARRRWSEKPQGSP